MKRLTPLLLLLICVGCKDKQAATTVSIALINNQTSLKITGIDYPILKDIAADTANRWETLLPVYRLPVDTELKDYQPAQPGKYQLKDSVLVFTPDTPFLKQQTYFMRYYSYGGDDNAWDMIKGKQRPGKLRFTDFTFKR